MKKVFKVVINVLLWGLLIFALLVTIAVFSSEKNNGVSQLFGFMPMSVESDSMAPTFNKEDLIIVREIDDLYDLKKDDVITFYTIIDGQRQLNTHRIVEVNKVDQSISFTTKGDANQIEDSLQAYSSDIVGKWTGVRIKGFGKVLDFMRTKKGFFICIVIPMALFFLFELYKFIVALIEFKRPALAGIDEEEIKKKAVEEYLAGLKQSEAGAGDNAPANTDDVKSSQAKDPDSTKTDEK